MNRIKVSGQEKLNGEVWIQSSKNATLPIMAASILAKGTTVLHKCPRIKDVIHMAELLAELGCKVVWEGDTLCLDSTQVLCHHIREENARKMRSSVILLGSMIARCQEVKLPYPGGCVIGKRPIDMHWRALEQLGVDFQENGTCFVARAKCLTGADITLDFPSVGATENTILAAVLAKGITHIKQAAREPEISYLCDFLRKMGAKIKWKNLDELEIEGVKKLRAAEYELPPDRIVAGTYMLAATAAKSAITLHNMPIKQLAALEIELVKMGAKLEKYGDSIKLDATKAVHGIPFLRTRPYPYFPTDLQSQMSAVLTVADCPSTIEETVFEARYKSAAQLVKMGANIHVDDQWARITPVKTLHGCEVEAQELRGGAALVIAGLIAEGETTITHCEYLERGYENICRDLQGLGAKISQI